MGDPFTPIAVGAGVGLLSRMLNRGQRTVNRVRNEAQLLDNVNAPDSSYGYPLRVLFGECKIDGCSLIWAKPLKEVITTTTSTNVQRAGGGKGGAGGSTTTVTETEVANYYMTAAFLIGGKIERIDRVWANGVLIYDRGNSNRWTDAFYVHTEIYTGSPTQPRSSVIGGDNPAFREASYIVFNDYPIELYRGSGFPKIDVQVRGLYWDAGNDRLDILATVIHIFGLAGISSDQITWNAWPGVVMYGAIYENTGESYATFIEDLCTIHGIDYYEEGGRIYFVKRQAPTWTFFIPVGDLCARGYEEELPDPFKKVKADPISVPSDVAIDFLSRSKEYTKVNCSYRDPSALHYNSVRFGTRIVTNEYDMINLAAHLVHQARLEANTIEELYLMPKWSFLRVNDPIAIYEKETCRVYRITEVFIADDYRIRVKAICTSTMALVPPPPEPDIPPAFPGLQSITPQVAEIATSYIPSTTPGIGTATLIPLDTHLINDDDPNYSVYVAVIGDSDWRGGTIYMSTDGGASYDGVGGVSSSSIIGTVDVPPVSMSPGSQSLQIAQSFTITGVNGSLSSVTQQKFDENDGLLFLVGEELIMAKNATLTGAGAYTIDYLKRGVRGTEWAMDGHITGETVVYMSGSLLKVPLRSFDIGKQIRFKAVGVNGSETSVTSYQSIASYAANSMKPYSPVEPLSYQDEDGAIIITWTRRDKRAGYATTYENLPLSETNERYEVEIVGGSTLTTETNNVSYSVAKQIQDFGDFQSSVTVNIYQMSADVGRGRVLTNQLNAIPISRPVMTVTDISPTFGIYGIANNITFTGTNLDLSMGAKIGNTYLTQYVIVSSTEVTATIPSTAVGGELVILGDTDLTIPPLDLNTGNYTLSVPEITVDSYSPTSHVWGNVTTVTFNGSNFDFAGGVRLVYDPPLSGALSLSNFTIVSSTQITADVTLSANGSGVLQIVADTNLPVPASDVTVGPFTIYSPTMTVTNFTPTSHTEGSTTTITINGTYLDYSTGATIGGVALTNYTVVSPDQVTATVGTNVVGGDLIVIAGTNPLPGGGDLAVDVNAGTFSVGAEVMTVSGFTPTSGFELTNVTITGTNFSGNAIAVKIGTGNTTLTNFTVVSDTQITATIPAGAVTGAITVLGDQTPPAVADVTAGAFTVTFPSMTASGFTPTSGLELTSITITGTGFTYAMGAKIGTTDLTNFVVVSDTQITATIPMGAITGAITVVGDSSLATPPPDVTLGTFTVAMPTMSISSFAPISGVPPIGITITGTGFNYATGGKIGTIDLTNFVVVSDTEITATVPITAETGAIKVVGDTGLPTPPPDAVSNSFLILGGSYTPVGSGLIALVDANEYSNAPSFYVQAPFTAGLNTMDYTAGSDETVEYEDDAINGTPGFRFASFEQAGFTFGEGFDSVFGAQYPQFTIMMVIAGPYMSSVHNTILTHEGGRIRVYGDNGEIGVTTGIFSNALSQSTISYQGGTIGETPAVLTIVVDTTELINTDRQKIRINTRQLDLKIENSLNGSGESASAAGSLILGSTSASGLSARFGKLAIWNRVLTSQEIADNETGMANSCAIQLPPPPDYTPTSSGLVFALDAEQYFYPNSFVVTPFDSPSHTITYQTGTSLIDRLPTALNGSPAFVFDGSVSRLSAGDILDDVFAGTSARFTMIMAVQHNHLLTEVGYLLAKSDPSSATGDIRLSIDDGKYEFLIGNDNSGYLAKMTNSTYVSQPVILTILFDHTISTAVDRLTLRVNGSNVATTVTYGGQGTFVDTTQPLTFGGYDGNIAHFKGLIGKIMIWNRILTAQEITDNENNMSSACGGIF